jgi:hypothetical protein
MTWRAFAEDAPGRHLQGRVQTRDAIPLVIVGLAGGQPRPQGQQRLGPIQGLHLRLLVHAQDDGVGRGAEVQPDDIVDLLLQPGIGAALEGLQPVGLQGMAPPDPMHRAGRHAGPSPSHPLSARATPPSRLLRQDAHGLEMWWITPVSPLVGVGRIRA